ncbi:SCP2 sterol-binding domain-containing protein [Streptomyces sp. NBC_01020]|uniref:SCP2 sterol-binding domain-containing protein n=1 Tax=unclassified Streptomyces TaxID=2593676 RepID=UPI002E2411BD|nr:SCP2 sterol-binding domain-containing protein [Streptomyces sp. NBC_01020]WSX66130.1 SCP2 sterol-binding domain-containing protein [Streptomyces sp. NBC_00932]
MADNISERLAELDFASVTPREFAKIIKGLSPRQLGEIARGDLRRQVLAEVFGRVERQFRPDSAGSLAAVIRWKITGESDVVYETTIADGVCTVTEGRSEADPRLTLTMGDADFLKLVSGNASPVTLFMLRKVKIAGDLGLASGLTRYFDIPKA